MNQTNARVSDTPKLRTWLPNKSIRDSIFTGSFFFILVAALFTGLFLAIDNKLPAGDDAWAWLMPVGSTISSVFLGFALSTWWSDWRRGDSHRSDAIRVDDQIEEEIQKISEHWQQTIHAIKALHNTDDRRTGFFTAVQYFFGVQKNFVSSRIQNVALEIDKLGFNSQPFLEEKRQRFTAMRKQVAQLIETMPERTDTQPLLTLLNEDLVLVPDSSEEVLPPDNTEDRKMQTTRPVVTNDEAVPERQTTAWDSEEEVETAEESEKEPKNS